MANGNTNPGIGESVDSGVINTHQPSRARTHARVVRPTGILKESLLDLPSARARVREESADFTAWRVKTFGGNFDPVRKPLLDRFNSFVSENRESFTAPSYSPLALLYSADGMKISDVNWRGVMGAEEILLRNHIPYRLLISRADAPPVVPEGCNTVLVADQKCLSDKEIAALKMWVENGGRMVVTGTSGDSNEFNRQRWRNPFAGSARREGFIYRAKQDDCAVDCGIWQYRIAPPKDGGRRLAADLGKVGLVQDVSLSSLPERVLIEMKRTSAGYAVHLLDYNPTVPVSGAMLHMPKGAKAVFKTLDGKCTEITENNCNCTVKLPDFTGYALVEVQELATHPQK